MIRRLFVLLTAISFTLASTVASLAQEDPKKAEAILHFKAGMQHFELQEWAAALAEFLESRDLYPSRSATKNAAYCLRKENRNDEALEMYEAFLRDFSDLTAEERAAAAQAVKELQALVGTVDLRGPETGASIVIDGRNRGIFPPQGPLRIAAGEHVLFVYKEGFLPLEKRFTVGAGQTVVVDARLGAITQGGRVRVTEGQGRVLDVVVDNVVVAKTPWEGTLAVGTHVILLRGPGDLGTQPAAVPVRLNQVTPVTLVAENLDASARVEPTPAGASIAIDGVAVGNGVWDGKLRAGPHRIEVADEGFLPKSRDVSLAKGDRQDIRLQLDRDPGSPLWVKAHPARIVVELDGAVAQGLLYGGDVGSSALPIGFLVLGRGTFQFGSGLGLGIEGGYMLMNASVGGRSEALQPVPAGASLPAGSNDSLSTRGLLVGAHASYHFGDDWPVTLRFGAGVFLGAVVDDRTYTQTQAGSTAASFTDRASATYLYLGPEARIGRRFGEHFEVNLGVEALVLTALSQPSWDDGGSLLATLPGGRSTLATFPHDKLAGPFILALAPGLGARYAF